MLYHCTMQNDINNTMTDFVLNFGKFKGQQFSSTPSWYQEWLPNQEWFKTPKPLHQQLNGWNGHSRKGEAIYDAIFEQEKSQALKHDCRMRICSCCQESKYYGM